MTGGGAMTLNGKLSDLGIGKKDFTMRVVRH